MNLPQWMVLASTALTLFSGAALAEGAPAAFVPAQAAPGCLDLGTFLTQMRNLPDSLFMHHPLLNLDIKSADAETGQPSSLATQHALDLFYHPNLATLGLAAGKNGGAYSHDFTAYQLDCAKVVTGDIFATEGMSVTWEIGEHTANSLTLKRLTSGGELEVSPDLSLLVRRFQVFAPTVFAITSAYTLKTQHACATPFTETSILTVTELFMITGSGLDLPDQSSPALKALMAQYPRVTAPAGHRGDFAMPAAVGPLDAACLAAPVVSSRI